MLGKGAADYMGVSEGDEVVMQITIPISTT
jgi:hypothetical protein